MVEAQGGDARVIDEPLRLPQPGAALEVPAPRDGIVTELTRGGSARGAAVGRRADATDDVIRSGRRRTGWCRPARRSRAASL
jgi:thymidine phosphorylase